MKIKLLVLSLLLVSFISCAQSTMSVEKDFWSGFAIHQNGNKISIADAIKIAKDNQEIVRKLSSAKTNRTIGSIIGYPGAFAFGYTIGLSLNKSNTIKPNWAIGGSGAALMIGGLILEGKGNKQLKEAVADYNKSISKDSSSSFNPEVSIISSENGIGLAMRF